MAANISPEHFHESEARLRKQIRAITDQIRSELHRLNSHPADSSGDPALYNSLIDQIIKIRKEVTHPDHIQALDNIVEKLRKAEAKAKNHVKNQDILIDLQAVNAELFDCRNLRG